MKAVRPVFASNEVGRIAQHSRNGKAREEGKDWVGFFSHILTSIPSCVMLILHAVISSEIATSILPWLNTSCIADVKNGKEICDLQLLMEPYWSTKLAIG